MTPDLRQRTTQLATACRAVAKEIAKLQVMAEAEGVRFPNSLPILLSQLDFTIDATFVILNTPHVTDAKNTE